LWHHASVNLVKDLQPSHRRWLGRSGASPKVMTGLAPPVNPRNCNVFEMIFARDRV
jgi:hypothetical protein